MMKISCLIVVVALAASAAALVRPDPPKAAIYYSVNFDGQSYTVTPGLLLLLWLRVILFGWRCVGNSAPARFSTPQRHPPNPGARLWVGQDWVSMAGTGLQGRARIFFVRFVRTAFFFPSQNGARAGV